MPSLALDKALAKWLNNAREQPAPPGRLEGVELLDKIIDIDPSPVGLTPRPYLARLPVWRRRAGCRALAMNVIRKQAIEELRSLVLEALGDHDAAVWLFGSCACGEPRQHSDIDVAILPRDEVPFGFFGELEADIEESTIPYDVDLVDLRNANPALIAEIRRLGVPWRD